LQASALPPRLTAPFTFKAQFLLPQLPNPFSDLANQITLLGIVVRWLVLVLASLCDFGHLLNPLHALPFADCAAH
jgi:hypothetical protein